MIGGMEEVVGPGAGREEGRLGEMEAPTTLPVGGAFTIIRGSFLPLGTGGGPGRGFGGAGWEEGSAE